ncbi:MAG: hypothetical protein ABW321_04060, partial [Polyangiales bacterium]
EAERAAQTQIGQLQAAYAQGDQLFRSRRWLEADQVFSALLAAIDALDPDVTARVPAGFSLERLRAQTRERAAQARARVLTPRPRAR